MGTKGEGKGKEKGEGEGIRVGWDGGCICGKEWEGVDKVGDQRRERTSLLKAGSRSG